MVTVRWDSPAPPQLPSNLSVTLRAPEVVDAVNRLITELRMQRFGQSAIRERLDDMSREMDDLIVVAHQTLDTEEAAAVALQKLFDMWTEAQNSGDAAKATALKEEFLQRRALLAQAIANTDPMRAPPPVSTTTFDPNLTTTEDPNATTPAPTTTEAGVELG